MVIAPTMDAINSAIEVPQLPSGPQQDLQQRLNFAIQQAAESFELMGLEPQAALNASRSAAWGHLRDMTPLTLARTKRQKHARKPGPTSSSSRPSAGWY
jgi:hypothetical protein